MFVTIDLPQLGVGPVSQCQMGCKLCCPRRLREKREGKKTKKKRQRKRRRRWQVVDMGKLEGETNRGEKRKMRWREGFYDRAALVICNQRNVSRAKRSEANPRPSGSGSDCTQTQTT